LDQQIRELGSKYKEQAFSERMVWQRPGLVAAEHICRVPVPLLKCPSYAGGYYADRKQEIYQDNYRHPGISNYVCIPGTHFKNENELVENGVIVSRAASQFGLSLDEICSCDGRSLTLLITETREPNYASWYDGQVNWVTAFPPRHVAAFDSVENRGDQDGDGVPDAVAQGWVTGLNYGPRDVRDQQNVYLSQFPYTKDQSYGGRQWGPSSMHAGGVVLHAFADAHTAAIAEDIDPDVYYALVTWNGYDERCLEGPLCK
jgi:hypothetical protein